MTSNPPARNRWRGRRQSNKYKTITHNRHEEEKPHWGDKLKSKHHNMFRICFSNVNNIGQHRNSYKTLQLKEVIEQKDIDLMCMVEMGVHWKSIPSQHTIWERIQGWFDDVRLSVGYNRNDPLAKRGQYGGTTMMAVNTLVAKINTTGYDPTGLGRWSWMLMRGKRDTITRVITAYCPCKPQLSGTTGQHTVYAQHLRHSSKEPIRAFWEDLGKELNTWINKDEQIILCGDWNADITNTEITSFMAARGLKEAILHRHGNHPPPTYHRGSHSIDGIFVSPSLLGIKGGYLEFGATPGDHRGIWVDVPQATIMGYKIPDIPSTPICRLQVKDPKSRNKYQTLAHTLFIRHGIYGKILHLKETAEQSQTTRWTQQFNAVDKEMEKHMLFAASKSRRIKMGGRKFSDKLQLARRTINLWRLVQQRLLGCKVNARTIIRARKKAGISNSKVTLQEATKLLDKAYKHYKIVRKNDEKHSMSFREKLAQDKAKEGNMSAAVALRQMNQQEQQRRDARRVKATLRRNTRCGTTRIQIQEGSRLKDITKKSEMETLIIAENEKKYHQTEKSCPLLQGQLLEDIGLLGDGPEVDNILNGKYKIPEGTSEAVKLWIKNLHIPNRDDREAMLTTLTEYRQGWKLVKEHTASGQLHFGHYKACAMHDMLAWATYVMASLPRATGFTPERWRRCTDVMLLKKEGLFLLDKLRTIVLYESDFNHENKRLGREAMNLALDKNMIAEEQYSRPGRSAQDNALNKRLMFDHQRMKRQPFAICACDLKSCYDRIVHNAASLALQRVGVRQSDIISMFGTIECMIHKVRTAFGDSENTYNADNPEFLLPVQGTGQGNGAGPSIWSILCSTIFEILHKEAYSSTFCYALSRGLYKICGFAYVDDCDLFYLGNDADEIFEGLASMLKMWDELMEVTGAAIAPDKCWWYLVDFTWHKGRWKCTDQGHQFEMQVRDKHGDEQVIKYLPSDVAKEMLGIYIAPDGNQHTQFKIMREKSSTWAQYMAQGTLTTEVSWNTLNTTIIKSLEYPLAATTFTDDELTSIIAPALQSGLPSSGICRSFPRAILYGSLSAQGLGLHNLYHTQNIRHIKDIVDQTWKNTPSAKLLRANMELLRLDAGIAGHLFTQNIPIPWVTTKNTIVYNTLEFCQQHRITFEEPGATLQLKREGDALLMEGFIAAGATIPDLCSLNRCRLYMRVTTISDISTGDGERLSTKAYNREPIGLRDTYAWPTQGKPPPTDWTIWNHYVRTELGRYHTYPKPLGKWTVPCEEFLEGWDYFVNPRNELIHHTQEGWKYFIPINNSRSRHLRYDIQSPRRVSNSAPRHRIFRTTIQQQKNIATTEGYSIHHDTTVIYNPPVPLDERFMHTLNKHEDSAWIMGRIYGKENIQEIINGLKHGTLVAVSDGSYHKTWGLATAAWSIINEPTGHALCGGGVIPGTAEDQNAYRAEASGLYGILIIINTIETVTGTTGKPITIACDGYSALQKTLSTYKEKFSSGQRCFDLISRIIDIRDRIRTIIQPEHVRGHQDEKYSELTLLEDWNVQMDGMAKQILLEAYHKQFQPPEALPTSTRGITRIQYQSIPITSQLDKTLREYITHEDAVQWWIQKERITFNTADKVDWNLVEDCMKESTRQQRKFIAKWVTNQLPVGCVQVHRRFQPAATCPRCGYDYEDLRHILDCPQDHARNLWNQSIRSFDMWLRKIGTDPSIQRAFSLSIAKWHAQFIDETYCPNLVSPQVKKAMREQGQISWDNFMTGLWSKQWAEIQDVYYKTKRKRNTGHRWAVKVSLRIWDIIKRQWDHRNSVLYRSEQKNLQGREELLAACHIELDLGLQNLEDVYSTYFETDIDTLETEKTYDIKLWLGTIRRAREASGYQYRQQDKISDFLRKWVGLRMDKDHRR